MQYMLKIMNIYPANTSKDNLSHKKQIILLMIPNEEEWHFLTVKTLSAL